MIQIRNVPSDLHRTLKVRAAQAGMSLSDYMLAEITKIAEVPTLDEMRARLQRLSKEDPPLAPVDLIREERDHR